MQCVKLCAHCAPSPVAATVLVGIKGDARCIVQGFTSSLTRLHCIISATGLPPPSTYDVAGAFQDLPLCALPPSTDRHASPHHR